MYPFTHILLKSIQTDTQMPHLVCLQLQTYYTHLPNFSLEFLIPNNSVDYPLPGLKCTHIAGTLTTPCTLLHISVYETLPKTIKT